MTTIKWGDWAAAVFSDEVHNLMLEMTPFCMSTDAEGRTVLFPAEDVKTPGVVVFEARMQDDEFQMRNTVAVGKAEHGMTGAEQIERLGTQDAPAHAAVFSDSCKEIIQHGNRRK